MRTIHILWGFSIAVAFLCGWAIRQTSSITRPAPVTAASSQKQAAFVQDKVNLSQSQAIHAAPEIPKNESFTEADSAATIERLMKLPSYVLRKAYDQKMKWMEKRSIERELRSTMQEVLE